MGGFSCHSSGYIKGTWSSLGSDSEYMASIGRNISIQLRDRVMFHKSGATSGAASKTCHMINT